MTLFDKIITIVLKNEGGYQCDPDDIGNYTRTGELKGTKYGICARTFPTMDIKSLTKGDAIAIYYQYWWVPMNLKPICNEELVLHILDHGINANKRLAIRMLQRIVEVKPDGIIGPVTIKAVNNWKPYPKTIQGYGLLNGIVEHYIYARHCYYSSIVLRRPVTRKYLKGWLNRVNNCTFS